jgi:Ni,Fe-hydrogenase maturation factor
MVKILSLGNEFIEEDSFAKKLSRILSEKYKHKITNIKDSFQFLEALQSKERLIILDVVQGLKKAKILKHEDLAENNIISAHDMDAGFFLQLMKPDVKIIGLPQNPKEEDIPNIVTGVERILKN